MKLLFFLEGFVIFQTFNILIFKSNVISNDVRVTLIHLGLNTLAWAWETTLA
jgi:hypothetical protein